MKKIIIKGLLFIIIGFLLGQFLFGEKIELIKSLQKKDTYYFLEEGIYYAYIGITRDKEVLEKLKSIYKGKNIDVNVKEINLESQEFKNNVEQFDLLIKQTNDVSQILTIEEVVIANYEEIIKKQ